MKLDFKRCIVSLYDCRIVHFAHEDETDNEAIARAKNKYESLYRDSVKIYTHPSTKTDIDYWMQFAESCKKTVESDFRVMTHEEYWQLKNEYLATKVAPQEITKSEYEDFFERIDVIYLGADKNYEAFNLRIFDDVYCQQYVHDFETDKYYTKLVKEADKSTDIVEMLKRKGIKTKRI